MKKTLFSLTILCISFSSLSQDNTLPNSGKVGLGTLNPSERLAVNGSVKIDSCLIVQDTVIFEKDARIDQDLKVYGDLYLPNLLQDSSFNGEILWKDANGQVKGGTKSGLLAEFYNTPCLQAVGGSPIPTWNNGINKIFVDCPDVHVGIGTSTPASKLHVIGRTLTGGLTVGLENDLNLLGNFVIKSYTNVLNETQPIINVHNDNGAVLQLSQNGLLRAREIKVDAATWPDYVFEKNYPLMSLEEVETFITTNGHLPNIPNAETMKEEGLNLAEMDKLLLEKIEELTLYIIAQEKRILELEAERAIQTTTQK